MFKKGLTNPGDFGEELFLLESRMKKEKRKGTT